MTGGNGRLVVQVIIVHLQSRREYLAVTARHSFVKIV